ncbi:MAG: phosphate/phosphite/phosphonate ABC transporter substrate-binding protein [Planctomycetota bacterium]|nr:phosphate/phosphite/phosphonate ABC transporter substrate-binding protein [Planctomycetota bacterium]
MSKPAWIILVVTLAGLLAGTLMWLGGPPHPPTRPGPDEGKPMREGTPLVIGLIPERDPLQIHEQYEQLARYLADALDRRVELATMSTYEGVLADFAEKHVDAAFLGSLVTVLAIDRQGARVLVKPELADGTTAYTGVLIVRDDSPVKSIANLGGRQIAMVKTTMAGHLYPYYLLATMGLLDRPDASAPLWAGTHDDVIKAVIDGTADAGAVKNLRLDEGLARHPEWTIRRLATGPSVPTNALVVRGDMPAETAAKLAAALTDMGDNPRGREVLKGLGMRRFLPCRVEEYGAIYDMAVADQVWARTGIGGPMPRRTTTAPAGQE